MRTGFIILLVIHAFIHIMGFSKAFNVGSVSQITKEITRPVGVLWLVAFLFFITTAVLFFLKKDYWFIVAIYSVILSQILICLVWQDAKAGTIANLIIGIVAFLNWGNSRFEKIYFEDVKQHQVKVQLDADELLTENDLIGLPTPIQNYLRYVGVLNKPKVKNIKVTFTGEMRDRGKDYFSFVSDQYNFFDEPARLFYMKVKMFGLRFPGYHKYSNGKASMDIRLFGMFKIIGKSGAVMDKTETVTLFNYMCLLAPATLIDKRIRWESIDDTTVKAIFTNGDIEISAKLFFNESDQLINFISEDRTAITEMKQYPFSTPVSAYKNINGFNLMSYGEAIWHYPEGPFTYGKFFVTNIEYNVK